MSLTEIEDAWSVVGRMRDDQVSRKELETILDRAEDDPEFKNYLRAQFGPEILDEIGDEIERLCPLSAFRRFLAVLLGGAP